MAIRTNTTTTAPGSVVPEATPLPVAAPGTPAATPGTVVTSATVPVVRTVPPAALAFLAIFVTLVGAWGGIVPFVGGLFGFSADGSVSWHWSLIHAVLWLAPGAVAFVIGLAMLAQVPRVESGMTRFGSAWTGLIAAICGAWFVIGPLAWPAIEPSICSGAFSKCATPASKRKRFCA